MEKALIVFLTVMEYSTGRPIITLKTIQKLRVLTLKEKHITEKMSITAVIAPVVLRKNASLILRVHLETHRREKLYESESRYEAMYSAVPSDLSSEQNWFSSNR